MLMTDITPEKNAMANAARFSKGDGQGRMTGLQKTENTKPTAPARKRWVTFERDGIREPGVARLS